MMEELRARFLPRFQAIARERVEAMRAPGATTSALTSQLHALAGEAGILGIAGVADLARAAEARWRSPTPYSAEAWGAALVEIEQAIERG